MERRSFVKKCLIAVALAGAFLSHGCGRKDKPAGHGNQEKLWHMANGNVPSEQPIELSYAKETPALYRDASMGKTDPFFVPRVAGG